MPYSFSAEDINSIFHKLTNNNHLAAFKTAFYGCLRAHELYHLELEDLDLDRLAITVHDGKGKTIPSWIGPYLWHKAHPDIKHYINYWQNNASIGILKFA